jgi:scyllo-inositol 2-dehydrogenase (NADP+)
VTLVANLYCMNIAPVAAPVRTAIIGYGFAGKCFHAYLVGLTPGLQLVGIASRDTATQQRIQAEQGCRAYTDIAEVLADPTIDLVILATPNSVHADQAVAALNAGKHVVSDKIMCLTLADCDRMLAAADANGKLLTVFQNRRFDGDFLTMKAIMESGELGDVRWIELAWQGLGAWGGWRGKAEMGGGRYFDLGAHLVDQLLQLFPEPIESVYCRMHHDFPQTNVESEALLIVTFAGGTTGVCDLSGMTAISKPHFLLKGNKATVAKYGLDPQERAMIAGDIDSAVNDPANDALLKSNQGERHIPTLPGRWRNYYENIADVLTTGASPVVKTTEMRRVLSVIDAGVRSAQTGQVVHLP